METKVLEEIDLYEIKEKEKKAPKNFTYPNQARRKDQSCSKKMDNTSYYHPHYIFVNRAIYSVVP